MATKIPKLKNQDGYPVDLNPRSTDTKYTGNEPLFHTQPVERLSALSRSFAWYNTFYDKKTARELLAQHLERKNRKLVADQIRSVNESNLIVSWAWLARMCDRGLELTADEQERLDTEITRLIKVVTSVEEVAIKIEKPTQTKPNIQEIMRERALEAGGELEGNYDDWMCGDRKTEKNTNTMRTLTQHNVLPQHISILKEAWSNRLAEYQELLSGNDSQLTEGYNHFSKTDIKNAIKFCEQVIADLHSYVEVKRTTRAKRAKRAVPVEKIVSKLKYLKEYVDPANKIELTSLHPRVLHGATEAWVYDTQKRKLHHYVADEHVKTLSVKGNTLLGFDKAQSEIKTLRKPAEQIKAVTSSKPAGRKYFKEIKTVATLPNGRFNEHMVILRAW